TAAATASRNRPMVAETAAGNSRISRIAMARAEPHSTRLSSQSNENKCNWTMTTHNSTPNARSTPRANPTLHNSIRCRRGSPSWAKALARAADNAFIVNGGPVLYVGPSFRRRKVMAKAYNRTLYRRLCWLYSAALGDPAGAAWLAIRTKGSMTDKVFDVVGIG